MSVPSATGKIHVLANNTTPPTPSKSKSILSESASESLQSSRAANLHDLGTEIPIIPLNTFFDEYLPPLKTSLRPSKILSYIKTEGIINDQGWTIFKTPKDRKRVHEDVCYADVKKVTDAIAAAVRKANKGYKPLIVVFKPNSTPRASFCKSSCRPDGTLCLRLRGKNNDQVWWDDVMIPAEFKKEDEDVDETNSNIEQIAWDMNQAMRNDPARLFTFGFTIENTTMRIWRCDRSDMVVSEAIDFISDYMRVLQFFLSVMYASAEELGRDPTMTRIKDEKGKDTDEYLITVNVQDSEEKLKFRTLGLLSFASADALRGRSTRVWRCELVDDTGETVLEPGPFALKDTWIDVDRGREGDIIPIIRALGETPEQKKDIQELVMDVRWHGDVYVDGKPDITLRDNADRDTNYKMFQLNLKDPDAEDRKQQARDKRREAGAAAGVSSVQIRDPKTNGQKRHYRLVYAQVGLALEHVQSLSMVCGALQRTLEALKVMHNSGWVHRDISSTNILIVGGPVVGQPKLIDFEYAKRYDQCDTHRMITANTFFVPIEIALKKYLFRPTTSANKGSSDVPLAELSKHFGWDVTNLKPPKDGQDEQEQFHVVLQHNPLHDTESVFWLSVCFVLNRVVLQVKDKWITRRPSDVDDIQKAIAIDLMENTERRVNLLSELNRFTEDLSCLDPSMQPLKGMLISLRKSLVDGYRAAEKDMRKANWFQLANRANNDMQYTLVQMAYSLAKSDILVFAFRSTKPLNIANQRPVNKRLRELSQADDN